jgi:hypothetical protein
VHFSITQHAQTVLGIETTDKWYTHTHTCPGRCMNRKMLVLWNQAVHTDRAVMENRPDMIIKKHKMKHAF